MKSLSTWLAVPVSVRGIVLVKNSFFQQQNVVCQMKENCETITQKHNVAPSLQLLHGIFCADHQNLVSCFSVLSF